MVVPPGEVTASRSSTGCIRSSRSSWPCRASSARRASSRSPARGRAAGRPRSSPRRAARSTPGPSPETAVIASIASSGTSTTSPTARSTVPARSRCSRSRVAAGAHAGDPLVHRRRRVRHRADDRARRRRGGARSTPSGSPPQPRARSARRVSRWPISPSSVSMSCGLTASTTTSAPLIASAFEVVASTPCRSRQLERALLAARRGDDVGPVGATQPGEQRFADLAGPEDRDPHRASLRVRRGIPPAGTRSRARPTPRTARAARRSPPPRRCRPQSAEASLTRPRSRASPRS